MWGRRLIAAVIAGVCFASGFAWAGATARQADAIVLMAGNLGERGPTAARLFCAGAAPLVLVTNDGIGGGWSTRHRRCLTHSEWARERLEQWGVPPGRVVLLPFSRSGTAYDVLAVLHHARLNRWQRLVVVTSPAHLPRTSWCFARFGSRDRVEVRMVPAAAAPQLRDAVIEALKLWWYRFRFGVLGAEPRLPL